jgi:WD40 repeat protein
MRKSFFLTLFTGIFFFPTIAQQPVLKLPTAHTAWITGFAVSNNGKYIATSSVDFTIKIWDYRTRKELRVLKGHEGSVNTVCFSPDDKLLLSGGNDATVKLWELNTGQCISSLDTMFYRTINDLCFSPDGKLVAGCSSNGVCVFDLKTKKKLLNFRLDGVGRKIRFFPNGKKLATIESDSSFSVWSIKDSAEYLVKESFHYNHGDIKDFFITRDGKFTINAVNTTIKNIRMHLVGGMDTFRFAGHTKPPLAVCAGENNDVFYSLSEADNPLNFQPDIEVKKWSISRRSCIDSFYFNHKSNSILNKQIVLSPQKELIIGNYETIFFLKHDPFSFKDLIHSRTTINNGIYQKDSMFVFTAEDGMIRNFDPFLVKFNMQNSGNPFIESFFQNDSDSIFIIQKAIKGKRYNSNILKYSLYGGNPDTVLIEPGYIKGTPGINLSDDGILMNYQIVPIINGKFRNDTARFKVYNFPSGKFIRDENASGIISDVKFLPDNRSYVLCTNQSNKFFYYRDTLSTIYCDTITDKYEYYTNLEVLDSSRVIVSNNNGISIWNLKTNKIENKILAFYHHGRYVSSVDIKLSVDKDKLLLCQKDTVKLISLATKEIVQTFSGEMGWVHEMAFSKDRKSIITACIDNTIRFWDIGTGKEKYKIVFIDSADWIIISPRGYYQCTPAAARLIHYVTKDNKIITFDQLDIKYNRPDKVLEAMGNTDTLLKRSYNKAYEKRMKKLGIDTLVFRDGYSVAEVDFVNRDKIEYEQTREKLTLHIKGADNTYRLDRFNVWVNEVPVFGLKGINLRKKKSNKIDTTITIRLSNGQNSIETSVINVNGTESYRTPLLVNYSSATPQTEIMRFVGIGIDKFADNKYDLQYSSKDIRDLSVKLKEKYGSNIIIDTLFNENVTVGNVKALKEKLKQTTVNDKVIIAYSGHGLLSKDFDYYLSTYSINFDKPEQNGLAYDELENLLDGIPARKKLMLIDACHSGEVDKEDLIAFNAVTDSSLKKGIKPVAYKKAGQLGLKNSFELMQSLFVNVGKSTGSTIISAAAGTQFALERSDLKNGVFTYSILEAMKNHPQMKISELKTIVGKRVEDLTKGLQKPTSRNETIVLDWSVW